MLPWRASEPAPRGRNYGLSALVRESFVKIGCNGMPTKPYRQGIRNASCVCSQCPIQWQAQWNYTARFGLYWAHQIFRVSCSVGHAFPRNCEHGESGQFTLSETLKNRPLLCSPLTLKVWANLSSSFIITLTGPLFFSISSLNFNFFLGHLSRVSFNWILRV